MNYWYESKENKNSVRVILTFTRDEFSDPEHSERMFNYEYVLYVDDGDVITGAKVMRRDRFDDLYTKTSQPVEKYVAGKK